MNEFFMTSAYAGVVLSLLFYYIGTALKRRFRYGLLNPLLISIALTICFLLVFHIDYDSYQQSARYLSWFLTPATICLAVPLYEQISLLRRSMAAILISITSGVLISLVTILILSYALGLTHQEYVTLLPKSITTAIGMGVCAELGGYQTITVAVIVITGVLGNMFGEWILRVTKITHPIAKGLAIGTSSHAIGTAKAMELGEIEGAMSSLSIAIAGLFTVIGASVFAMFL